MNVSSAVSPVTLASLTGISPASFRALAGVTDVSALLLSPSSVVQLSALGQVLSSGSSLADSIQALQQTDASSATPGTVESRVQNFVAAFNQVETSLGNAQPLLGSSSTDALVSEFSSSLTAAATDTGGSVNAGEGTNLGSLQSIGIRLQIAISPSTGEPTLNLQLDQKALDAAASADPGGTLRVLDQATQPLLQTVSAFETQATQSASTLISGTSDSTAVDLLASLSSAASQNSATAITPDLSALGINTASADDTATPASANAATQRSTAALVADSASATAVQTTSAAVTSTLDTTVAGLTPTPAVTPTALTPALADQAAPAPPTQTDTGSEAEQDPSQGNIQFNPFYAATAAAYVQNILVPPGQLSGANNYPGDLPAPIAPIAGVNAVRGFVATA